jgi:hypothetical protein
MGPWLIITPAWAAPAARLVRASAQALAAPAVIGATAFVVIGVLALLLGARVRRATAAGRRDRVQAPATASASGSARSLSGS